MIQMMNMWMFFLFSFRVVLCSLLVNLECHNCREGAIFGIFGPTLGPHFAFHAQNFVTFVAGVLHCHFQGQCCIGDVGGYSIGADSTNSTTKRWCKGFVGINVFT